MHFLVKRVIGSTRLPATLVAGAMVSAAAFAQVDDVVEEGAVDANPAATILAARPVGAVDPAVVRAPDLTTPTTEAHLFSDVDYTNDYRLVWEEIVAFYESELRQNGWTRIEFINKFDTDGDEFLDEEEYLEFLDEAGLEEPEEMSSFIDID